MSEVKHYNNSIIIKRDNVSSGERTRKNYVKIHLFELIQRWFKSSRIN